MIEPESSSGIVALTCFDPLRIGGREELLGWKVRRVAPAVHRLEVARGPVRRRKEADRHVGARAVEPNRVVALLGQPLRVRLQLRRAFRPRVWRIVRVESADVGDVLPELHEGVLAVEAGVHELGPRPRRRGDDAPARRHPVDDLARLREVGEEVAPCAGRVEAVERTRSVRTRERDARGVLVGEVEEPFPHPRRDEVERVVRRERDAFALEPLIEVEDVDVLRAALVGGARDPARQLFLPDVARDRDELPRLDVRAEHREGGELVCPRLDLGPRRQP